MRSVMQILLFLESYNLQAFVTSVLLLFDLLNVGQPPTTTHLLWIGIIQIIIKLFKY